jgi:hypothetical protein
MSRQGRHARKARQRRKSVIEENNNDYDLSLIEIDKDGGEFQVGETRRGRANYRHWLVHFRDATTFLIAPVDRPDQWRPAHIYTRNEAPSFEWFRLAERN